MPTRLKNGLRLISDKLISRMWCKILLNILCSVMVFITAILPVMDCQNINKETGEDPNNTSLPSESSVSPSDVFNILDSTTESDVFNTTDVYEHSSLTLRFASNIPEEILDEGIHCLFAPYYLYGCMMSLISCSVFLRTSYFLKSIFMLILLVIYNLLIHITFSDVFELYDSVIETDFLPTTTRGSLYTALLFITLVILDRQIEKNFRLDYLYKWRMREDKLEYEKNEMLNNMLLANILPVHVAKHYLTPGLRAKNDLYHQHCQNVCIMFAAIPDFKVFFSTVDVTGKECLRLLNEIISVFDKMLLMRQFDGVEKIKTIGSTYMAAAGLRSCTTSRAADSETSAKNVMLLVEFARAMEKELGEISQDAFVEYSLRVGINHGDVVAGVVGASKPQYDIWGDAVNIASRMETNGIKGNIQVREATADLLKQHDIECNYRDTIPIKGKKQPIPVYLIPLKSRGATSNAGPVIISDIKITNARYSVDSNHS